jgi:hypothetical protein
MKLTSVFIHLLLALVSIATPSISKSAIDIRSGRYIAIAASIERNINPANRKLLHLHHGSSSMSSLKVAAKAVYRATIDLPISLSTITLMSTIPNVKAMPGKELREERIYMVEGQQLDAPHRRRQTNA